MDHKICTEELLQCIPKRDIDAHKGQVGKVLLLCGSVGLTGAASLCAMGALRSGAGLVYVGVPRSVYPIVAGRLTESIVFPLPSFCGKLSVFSKLKIKKMMAKVDAVVIGPGLGKSFGTLSVVKTVLNYFKGPVVLDADGINVIAAHKSIMRGRTFPLVITPHEGEFRRLSDASGLRIDRAEDLARELGVVVLLKGHHTVITDGSNTYVNPTGNPGMAVGGSGDVLSGILGTFLAQGVNPIHAAACAAWIHGKAGDVCAEKIGMRGMLPTDMLDVLPRLLK